MRVRMYKKLVIFCLVVLLFGTSCSVSSSSSSKKDIQKVSFIGNTLYVGGNGSGNYSKIQDAIDNASDGDTIFVYDDISPYLENLTIDKSINLVGEDRDTTVIQTTHNKDVIIISADGVNISGFTIQNGDNGILLQSNYCNIYYNFINNSNSDGISSIFHYSSFNTITDNIFSTHCLSIWITGSNNEFSNNVITSKSSISIFLCSGSRDNFILNNYIICKSQPQHTIFLENSKNNTISGNTIINKDKHDDELSIGISIGEKGNNIVSGNQIYNFTRGISSILSDNNQFIDNHIENSEHAIFFSGKYNKIKNNNFIKSSEYHISYGFLSRTTDFDGNYWDDWIGVKYPFPFFQIFPKIIIGLLWVSFDWNPAKEQYDI